MSDPEAISEGEAARHTDTKVQLVPAGPIDTLLPAAGFTVSPDVRMSRPVA